MPDDQWQGPPPTKQPQLWQTRLRDLVKQRCNASASFKFPIVSPCFPSLRKESGGMLMWCTIESMVVLALDSPSTLVKLLILQGGFVPVNFACRVC